MSMKQSRIDVVQVSSRLKLLWFLWIRGYRLQRRQQSPTVLLLGRVFYKTTWYLEEPNRVDS